MTINGHFSYIIKKDHKLSFSLYNLYIFLFRYITFTVHLIMNHLKKRYHCNDIDTTGDENVMMLIIKMFVVIETKSVSEEMR